VDDEHGNVFIRLWSYILHFKHMKLTNNMEQSLQWDANSRSAGKENSCLLWNPKVYCVHKSS